MQHVSVSHATTLEQLPQTWPDIGSRGQLEERLNTHLSIVYDYSRHVMTSDQGSWSLYVRPDGVTICEARWCHIVRTWK